MMIRRAVEWLLEINDGLVRKRLNICGTCLVVVVYFHIYEGLVAIGRFK